MAPCLKTFGLSSSSVCFSFSSASFSPVTFSLLFGGPVAEGSFVSVFFVFSFGSASSGCCFPPSPFLS